MCGGNQLVSAQKLIKQRSRELQIELHTNIYLCDTYLIGSREYGMELGTIVLRVEDKEILLFCVFVESGDF